ncbi:methylmalonyl-CoA epimerase [Haloglycomyces albus]|uniref:methylmalonyl-CoA epimerase n=1 Tax=Haloglycomyces albus TaxID=526067 RepID=UPI00046CB22B|nr:methylmalonyl-CoA epimerase [Haloglycomyces albus]
MSFETSFHIRRVDHVGVAVADLDKALERYEGFFGGECVHREENEEQGVIEAMVSWPDGDTQLQVLAPLRDDSPIGKFLDKRGPGLQQMALTVDDIDAVCAGLTEQGVELLYERPRHGTADSRINFVHPRDAEGVLLELVEPAKR